MRTVFWFAAVMLSLSGPGLAETDVAATCYRDCEARTNSNPEFEACLARAADAADTELNQAYKVLQGDIRTAAKEMGQAPDIQLEALVGAQKKWIAYRDANCTFEDELAFGGTSIGGNQSACLCALTHARIADFARIRRHLLLGD
jgi:uncharacterized protein YecT (DUF1311 family)